MNWKGDRDMSIKVLNKYIQICKALNLQPTFEGLNKTAKIIAY